MQENLNIKDSLVLLQIIEKSFNLSRLQIDDREEQKSKYLKLKLKQFQTFLAQKLPSMNQIGNFLWNTVLTDKKQQKSYPAFHIQQILIPRKETPFFGKFVSKQYSNLEYIFLKIYQKLYIFNNCFMPVQASHELLNDIDINEQIIFVLTQLSTSSVLSYLQLCLTKNMIIKCLIPVNFEVNFCQILQFVFGGEILQTFNQDQKIRAINLINYDISLTKERNFFQIMVFDQKTTVFDYEGSSITFEKNLYYYPTYNCYIVLNGANYAIYTKRIQNQEIAYKIWKSGFIQEKEYAQIIDKRSSLEVVWSSEAIYFDNIYEIGNSQIYKPNKRTELIQKFKQCDFFSFIPNQIVNQIYNSGRILTKLKGQVLQKSHLKWDNFYIVLKGNLICQQEDKVQKSFVVKPTNYCDISSIFNDQIQTQRKKTLKVLSQQCVVFEIQIWKIRFCLGHFISKIKQIIRYQIEDDFLKQIRDLSVFEKKNMRNTDDMMRVKQKSQRIIGKQKLRVRYKLWKKICNRNLDFLIQTSKSY